MNPTAKVDDAMYITTMFVLSRSSSTMCTLRVDETRSSLYDVDDMGSCHNSVDLVRLPEWIEKGIEAGMWENLESEMDMTSEHSL